MLTAQHVAKGKGEFKGGFFFLGRHGTKGFTAKYKIEGTEDLVHHTEYPNANKNAGTDISAVRIVLEEGDKVTEVPDLVAIDVGGLDGDMKCTISGYPK